MVSPVPFHVPFYTAQSRGAHGLKNANSTFQAWLAAPWELKCLAFSIWFRTVLGIKDFFYLSNQLARPILFSKSIWGGSRQHRHSISKINLNLSLLLGKMLPRSFPKKNIWPRSQNWDERIISTHSKERCLILPYEKLTKVNKSSLVSTTPSKLEEKMTRDW